ncbi:MAG: pilus assembly protein [Coriobacteriaceae bacterium]|jgi:hypothetical protein|nr:pilus assembly protein [Coriobacteriaceae bacterium]
MSFCTDRRGQASVEAAFIIPLLFIVLLLLVQPGILLYTHMVMQGAASEGCRLLATKTDALGASEEKYKGYILRRLGSVPMHECFHAHADGCSWEIELQGDETSREVKVIIRNKLRLLPLIDSVGGLFKLVDGDGFLTQEVVMVTPTQPGWAALSDDGLDPQAWLARRLEETS